MSDFGDKIRALRLQKRFSQQYVSDRIGIPQTTLSSLERGLFEPSFETIYTFADFYEVSPYSLLPFETETVESKMYETADTIARNEKLRRLFDICKILPDYALDSLITVADTLSKGTKT